MVEVACCRCLLHKLFDLIASDEPILKGAFDAADDARCVAPHPPLGFDAPIPFFQVGQRREREFDRHRGDGADQPLANPTFSTGETRG